MRGIKYPPADCSKKILHLTATYTLNARLSRIFPAPVFLTFSVPQCNLSTDAINFC